MPVILLLLCGLMVLGVASSLIVGAWVSAALQALLLVGVASGKEGARKALILLSLISIGVIATFILLPLVSLFDRIVISKYPFRPDPLDGFVVVMTYALFPSFFTIFALTRRNVQQWMYTRSMGELSGLSSKRSSGMDEATALAAASAGRPLFIAAGLLFCSAGGLYAYTRTVDIAAEDTERLLNGEDYTQCGGRPDPNQPDEWGRFITPKAQREEQLAAWLRCLETRHGPLEDPASTRAGAKQLRFGAVGLALATAIAVAAGVLRRKRVRARLEAPPSAAPKS